MTWETVKGFYIRERSWMTWETVKGFYSRERSWMTWETVKGFYIRETLLDDVGDGQKVMLRLNIKPLPG